VSVDVPTVREPARVDPRRPTGRDVALVDLVDRLLAGGVVLCGEIILAAADVDLVRVDLRALISSVPEGATSR
jgi:Gas vesicle protein